MDSTTTKETTGVGRIGVERQGEDVGEMVRPRSWGASTPSESYYLSPLVTPSRSAGDGNDEYNTATAMMDDEHGGSTGDNEYSGKKKNHTVRNIEKDFEMREADEDENRSVSNAGDVSTREKTTLNIQSVHVMKKPIKIVHNKEMSSIEISSDSESGCSNVKRSKRKRGNLETEIVLAIERHELKRQLREANRKIEDLEGSNSMMDNTRDSTNSNSSRKRKKNYPKMEELLEEYSRESVHALEAELLSHIEAVEEVAKKSGRLQGPMQRVLCMSSLHIQAGISEYVRRMTATKKAKEEDSSQIKERKKLESQIVEMRDEICVLRNTIADLKEDARRHRYLEEEGLLEEVYSEKEELKKKIDRLNEENKELEMENEKFRKLQKYQEEQERVEQQQTKGYNSNNKKSYDEFPPLPGTSWARTPDESNERMKRQPGRRGMRVEHEDSSEMEAQQLEEMEAASDRRTKRQRRNEDEDLRRTPENKKMPGASYINRDKDRIIDRDFQQQQSRRTQQRDYRNDADYREFDRKYNYNFRRRKERERPEVVVMYCDDEKCSYAEATKKAKEKIDIGKLGIKNANMRRAMNGGLIIQVTEGNNKNKADALAKAMREVFDQEGIYISRPVKKSEIRLTGIDEDTTEEDILEALIKLGGARKEEIKVGRIRRTSYGRKEAWIACPTTLAEKIQITGVKVGWSNLRVRRLLPRPVQCFRCLEYGHLKVACKNVKDRSGICYRCGETGHIASSCQEVARCVICKESGKNYKHRMGSGSCFSRMGNYNKNIGNRIYNNNRFNRHQEG